MKLLSKKEKENTKIPLLKSSQQWTFQPSIYRIHTRLTSVAAVRCDCLVLTSRQRSTAAKSYRNAIIAILFFFVFFLYLLWWHDGTGSVTCWYEHKFRRIHRYREFFYLSPTYPFISCVTVYMCPYLPHSIDFFICRRTVELSLTSIFFDYVSPISLFFSVINRITVYSHHTTNLSLKLKSSQSTSYTFQWLALLFHGIVDFKVCF